MYKVESNIDQFIAVQLSTFEQLMQGDKILREAALNSVVLISDRVQQRGEKSDGTKIGKYSENKLKFKAITSRFSKIANKKQKKAHSGEEFEGGYKEFREKLGLQTEFIDETVTGDMMGDLIAEPDGEKSYVVGFRGESAKIAGYQEERFGPIFQLTVEEQKDNLDIIQARVNDILRK